MTHKLPPTLVVLSPGDLLPGSGMGLVARWMDAAGGGATGLLLREPQLSDGEFLVLARRLRECIPPGVGWLGVHDRVHLAPACAADAVHLGFRSLPSVDARAVLPPEVCIGLSTHVGDEPRVWSGADYLFHGPLHTTASKVGRVEPVGIAGLAGFCAQCPLPVWALGGVRPADVPHVLRAGSAGVAVLSGVLADREPARAAARYLQGIPA